VIVFCINCYQDAELIGDCIDSIKSSIENQPYKIVVIDGVYKSFAEQSKIEAAKQYSVGNHNLGDSFMRFTEPMSIDGTIEIVKSKGVDIIIQSTKPWKDEIEKRSQYLKFGEDGDYLFVIDSDENIIGKIPQIELIKQSDNWTIQLQRDDKIPKYPVFRLHKYYQGMRYIGFHNGLHIPTSNGMKLLKKADYENQWILPDIYLNHRWSERGNKDQIRHQSKGAYYRELLKEENEFRDKNGI
jgi:hypothetical protein